MPQFELDEAATLRELEQLFTNDAGNNENAQPALQVCVTSLTVEAGDSDGQGGV